MPASPTATPEHIKDVNTRYHDAAADEYDAKWGIDFGDTGQEQVRLKLVKALGGDKGERFGDALEIGSGTGYFSLNLVQLGVIERLTATDISPGMLKRLQETAEGLGVEGLTTVATEAEELPFEDESFDLVFGHAVLHHIPDLDRAFAEFRRVLRPGGAIAFAGEPSRYGDRLAALPKRAGMLVAPAWRRLTGARQRTVVEADLSHGHSLEGEVDVHAFAPADLRKLLRDGLGLGSAHGRVNRRAGLGLLGLAQLRLPQLHRPAEGRHPPARAAPAGRALLQPARLRPQACLSGAQAGAEAPERARNSFTRESIPFSRRSPMKV
jgi:ubiquinone/menaquinone biosynthesis C-methylase UbiE